MFEVPLVNSKFEFSITWSQKRFIATYILMASYQICKHSHNEKFREKDAFGDDVHFGFMRS